MNKERDLLDAVKAGKLQKVEELLDLVPGLVNRRQDGKVTAVLLAMYNGREDIARAFVTRGAKLNLYEACATGELETVRLELSAHPQLASHYAPDGFTPLALAAFFGRANVVKLLLERGAEVNVASKNKLNVMPLHSACARGDMEVVCMLLAAGADVNAKQQAGFTPLHAAAQTGNAELAKILLAAGADPDTPNDEGVTPRQLAKTKGLELA